MAIVWLETSIRSNRSKTIMLLILFPTFLFGLIFLALLLTSSVSADAALEGTWGIFAILWPIILIWAGISFWFHRQIVFKFTWARPITRKENPEIYNIVENLCISRGLSIPKIGIIDDDSYNAFATGWNDKNAWIVFSRWIINKLNKREIEAVAAHELTHIINKDSLLMITIIAFIWAIAGIWEIMFRITARSGSSRGSKNSGQAKLIIRLVAICLIILWYIIFPIVRLAISRKREYLADAGSVALTKDPESMISALRKISGDSVIETIDKPSVAAMCIANPFSKGKSKFMSKFKSFFSTHPSIEDRVEMLQKY